MRRIFAYLAGRFSTRRADRHDQLAGIWRARAAKFFSRMQKGTQE